MPGGPAGATGGGGGTGGRHCRGRRRLRRWCRRRLAPAPACRLRSLRTPLGKLRRWCDRWDRIEPAVPGVVAVAGLLLAPRLGGLRLGSLDLPSPGRASRPRVAALAFGGFALGPRLPSPARPLGLHPWQRRALRCIRFWQLRRPACPSLLSLVLGSRFAAVGPTLAHCVERELDLPRQVLRRRAPRPGAPAAWRCGPDGAGSACGGSPSASGLAACCGSASGLACLLR